MPSENVKVVLRGKVFAWVRVVHALSEQIVDQTDSEQIEVSDTDGISCVTTDPAPITTLSPICTFENVSTNLDKIS